MLKRVFNLFSLITALLVSCYATTSLADVYVEEVSFSCSGKLVQIVEADDGQRATGLVDLTITLPNENKWLSAGLVVVSMPESAKKLGKKGRAIKRCRGVAELQAQVTGTLSGVDVWTINLVPTQVLVRMGKQRLTDPGRVEFSSQAGGSPNV